MALVEVAGATPSHLALILGKDQNAYLINRDNLGGITTPVIKKQVAQGEIASGSAVYAVAGSTYIAFNGSGAGCPAGQNGDLVAMQVSAQNPPTLSIAWCASQNGAGSPIVTSPDGVSSFIVWGLGAEGDNRLHGFDGATGQVIFAGGGNAEQMDMVQHFQTPIVAKGPMYVGSSSKLYAFLP
ncbi:MAG: hypothetical protein C5B49_01785 [Bdellovibrio sp.]|nr:MAG: hypothetical protein C5B49_01785 [Bdellovibrio sp.]